MFFSKRIPDLNLGKLPDLKDKPFFNRNLEKHGQQYFPKVIENPIPSPQFDSSTFTFVVKIIQIASMGNQPSKLDLALKYDYSP